MHSQATAENILHVKKSDQKGSNPGGLYEGQDGQARYVKFYTDATQSFAEHVTNAIYKALGLAAPESTVFRTNNGTFAYASVFQPGLRTFRSVEVTPTLAKDAMEGFAADVLTANWDAAGTGLDNFNVTTENRTIRIDSGGSLLFRAQAGRKQERFLNDIPEWDGFFNSSLNPDYLSVANKAGYKTASAIVGLATQIRKIQGLDLVAIVNNNIDSENVVKGDVLRIQDMLERRKGLLVAKLATLDS